MHEILDSISPQLIYKTIYKLCLQFERNVIVGEWLEGDLKSN